VDSIKKKQWDAAMKTVVVSDAYSEREFIQFPKRHYRTDPNWVCPLDADIKALFDPELNPLLQKGGQARRWLLYNEENLVCGRISAFFHPLNGLKETLKTGGLGHFECINDSKAAHLLFDTAIEWLKEHSLQAVDAPVNFGENNNDWGLLVKGFTQPVFGMNYHYPYYQQLFEDYGFKLYFKQYSYLLDMTKKFPERFWKIAEWVNNKPGYSFEHFSWERSEKYLKDLVSIYNEAWASFKQDFNPMQLDELRKSMEKARPIVDPEMVWFAYYHNRPIAFYVMFPDVNQILKKLNGKLSLWNKLRFYFYKKTNTITRARAQVAGVVPDFQNSGVESAIFYQLKGIMEKKPHITEVDLSWVGDFNPKMRAIYEAVGATHEKTHHTYRLMLDESVPFERFMADSVEIS